MTLRIMDRVRTQLKTYTMILALLVIWLLFGFLTNWVFFSPTNLSNLFRQMTIISFLAIGMVMVIVSGGGNIDLSVGSVTGFIGVVAAGLQAHILSNFLPGLFPHMPPETMAVVITILTVVICLIVGAIIGMYQGALIAYLGIPAFVVTLGGMQFFRGALLGYTQGKTIVPIEPPFKAIAQGYLHRSLGLILAGAVIAAIFIFFVYNRRQRKMYGFPLKPIYVDLLKAAGLSAAVAAYVLIMNDYQGIQNPVLLMALMAVIFSYIMNNTRFGRYVYAIGGNREATRLSGINIKRNVFKVFILMGILCSVSGLVLTARVAAGSISGGTGYELSAIASCVIGGTSLLGGEGTILGAIIGSLIMASLDNGMSVMNMGIEWQMMIRGLVLIFAVYVDVISKRSR
jgi:D-xylose transport system permease protein